ncbi:type VI immunity family protein [Melittangium boletus]|uniref:DUF3396 domain-containing protein n=1 Tax=Melittangium boletus DSM 14713 TaxID=1294270 RepID=A0A250IDY3_9BACT|nr:type VI immunity family protein [Melittangium boletus]ATB29351.1 hypothetical protein MEBOL_002800 [Melittangium boletus DSM 14713]
MKPNTPHLRVHARNGQILIRDGISLCFYMRRPHEEVAPAVMASLDAYLRAVGPQALGWYLDTEGDWQELDAPGWELTRREMYSSSPVITLKDTPGGAGSYRFEYHGKSPHTPLVIEEPHAVCAAEFWLPTDYLEEHGPERVRELTMELAAPLPFSSGHADLSFNALDQLVGVSRELRSWCFRYPGMSLREIGRLSWKLGSRVPGVHWLTFLGQPVLGELGGASRLRSRLVSPDISVHELDSDRALVTLGEWPDAGDTEQGHSLPLHRELARVLEPWLHHRSPPWGGFTPEELLRWERRFLD